VRRGGLWAKHMGFKQGVVGRTHGEHIGNLLGTKEREKSSSFAPPPPPASPKLKRKKHGTLSAG